MKKALRQAINRELEQKQRDMFERGHQGRRNSRRYVQLIEAQAALNQPRKKRCRKKNI
jgi:hypothetical protein